MNVAMPRWRLADADEKP